MSAQPLHRFLAVATQCSTKHVVACSLKLSHIFLKIWTKTFWHLICNKYICYLDNNTPPSAKLGLNLFQIFHWRPAKFSKFSQIFQIFSNFPMHTSVWHCVAAPPLATGWPRSRSFLTARVASVKQIVIIIIKLVIIIHWGQKNQISRNLLKTMSNFFFCQAQLGINVYYREKKIRKSWKTKILIGIEVVQKKLKILENPKITFF